MRFSLHLSILSLSQLSLSLHSLSILSSALHLNLGLCSIESVESLFFWLYYIMFSCFLCYRLMGIHSYSLSNSSTPRYDIGECIGDGEFGIPRRCACGGPLEEKTSHTETNPARKFFACRLREKNGYHTWKWWDHAVEEELTILSARIEKLIESIQMPKLEEETRLDSLRMEIAKVKAIGVGLCLFVAVIFFFFK